MKISKLMSLIVAGGFHVSAEEQNNTGNIDDLITHEHIGNTLPDDWDTRLPEPGKIRLLAEILVGEAIGKIAEKLPHVPDGPTGKGSSLHAKITAWHQEAQTQMEIKTRAGLLRLNAVQAEIMTLAKTGNDMDPSLMEMAGHVQNSSKALIYNISDYVSENQNPNQEQLEAILACFSIEGFVEESEWEDVAEPIDPAGVLILQADSVCDVLKIKNAEFIRAYLRGYNDNEFFERYEEAGNGMQFLKSKYAANKEYIQAKFAELLDLSKSHSDFK